LPALEMPDGEEFVAGRYPISCTAAWKKVR
jgi:hypothetical protein